ncbi:MAG: ATP-dependent Clp protease ATP-binding subunit [Lachnospiraceae bacterium]|nr:ATP-dependent Clp protease ATP-binding subunit [Lachnospiraceae bacterium]
MQSYYTKQAEEVLKTARTLAKKMGNRYVGTEHLLVALRKVYRTVAGQVLAQNGVKEEDLVKVVNELVSPVGEKQEVTKPEESPRLSYILENSKAQAMRLHAREIGTEHMLLAILEDTECVGARILATLNIQFQRIVEDILQAVGAEPEEYKLFQGGEKSQSDILEQYSTDLTRQAMEGKLDAVIGREEEIARIMQILSRRTKNNPCLIGETGVGKTAIVEGLALRIANGSVPDAMKSKKILTLDLAGMVAGSKYRGEFEDRMKKLIREVKTVGNVILFLDEVHTIIGAGGAEGAIDASNMLKPSLARGEIQLIGATTIAEYRKYIEKDAALERRFQPITVEEPTKEQCMAILEGIQPKYEAHHGVSIEKEALEAAVELSKRYVTDRNLPDKAIDILDEACSKVSLAGFKVPQHIHELEETLEKLAKEKEEAVKNGQMQEASLLNHEQEAVREKLESAKKRFQRANKKKQICVTEEAIAEVVSAWTKIPVQKLAESETTRLLKLDKILHKRVVGQEEAVIAVTKAVKRGRVGLKDPNRPIGSFLFLGPTGVGKTELSKALAEALFGNEDALIRVDMSEYMEKHSVSKMIGSPPGYVGHDDGGQLSEKVRRSPYSVILFDEIEKAHPDVFNILLQVLDDGHITDSQGRKVDFKNTVIIMTSNAGAKAIVEPKKLGFITNEDADSDYKKMKSNVMDEVKQLFKPEFLNRIDEIIVFHALNKEQMKKIVNLMCKELADRVEKQLNIKLTIRDSVKKEIVEKGTDLKYGARPLRRAMQNILEDKMADAILDGEIKSGTQVDVGMAKKEIKFMVKPDKELVKK